MSMSKAAPAVLVAAIAAVVIAVFAFAGRGAEGPKLGTPASEEQIAGWDISITPDGKNLPQGAGTARQGAEIFRAQCAGCHGVDAQGRSAESLAGGVGTLADKYPEQTVGSYWPYATTLYDYIRRAMPPEAPFSLSADEIYAICAFILHLNGLMGPDEELNQANLPQIEMPNRGGFIQIYKQGEGEPP